MSEIAGRGTRCGWAGRKGVGRFGDASVVGDLGTQWCCICRLLILSYPIWQDGEQVGGVGHAFCVYGIVACLVVIDGVMG